MEHAIMERMAFQAEEADKGRRLDVFLSENIEGITRSHVQKLIEGGMVGIEGRGAAAKNYKLRTGDRIIVSIPEPETLEAEPENIPIFIAYEDEDLLVVDKPQGMVVHPAPGNSSGTLVNALLYHCGSTLSSINGTIRPGIVHRIDKDTSGLLVVAKSDRAHMGLAEQFSAHSIRRAYRAVVYNGIRSDVGTIDLAIARDPKDRLRMAVVPRERGRRAVTHYRVLDRSRVNSTGFTYVECRLETGRTHQIRVHMANMGHPLLGDPVYGPKKPAFGIRQQVLHAKELGFIHPVTGAELFFESPLPDSFVRALEKTGLRDPQMERIKG